MLCFVSIWSLDSQNLTAAQIGTVSGNHPQPDSVITQSLKLRSVTGRKKTAPVHEKARVKMGLLWPAVLIESINNSEETDTLIK
jgi:hypothetical protein